MICIRGLLPDLPSGVLLLLLAVLLRSLHPLLTRHHVPPSLTLPALGGRRREHLLDALRRSHPIRRLDVAEKGEVEGQDKAHVRLLARGTVAEHPEISRELLLVRDVPQEFHLLPQGVKGGRSGQDLELRTSDHGDQILDVHRRGVDTVRVALGRLGDDRRFDPIHDDELGVDERRNEHPQLDHPPHAVALENLLDLLALVTERLDRPRQMRIRLNSHSCSFAHRA